MKIHIFCKHILLITLIFIKTYGAYANMNARTILLCGQSNAAHPSTFDMEGLSVDQLTGVPDAYLYNYDWYSEGVDFYGNLRAYGSVTNAWGPELVFGRDIQRMTDRTVYIIKYAVGGTTIDQWLPGHVDDLYSGITNAISAARIQYPNMPAISAFVWAQGESDGVSEIRATNYGSGLEALYSALKKDVFKGEDILTLISGLGPKYFTLYGEQTAALQWGPIVTTAQVDFCTNHPFSFYVNASDIEVAEEPATGSPWVHYTANGKHVWGNRIANIILNEWDRSDVEFCDIPDFSETAYHLSWYGISNHMYRIESSTNLTTAFRSVAEHIQGSAGTNTFLIEDSQPAYSRFYRIKLEDKVD